MIHNKFQQHLEERGYIWFNTIYSDIEPVRLEPGKFDYDIFLKHIVNLKPEKNQPNISDCGTRNNLNGSLLNAFGQQENWKPWQALTIGWKCVGEENYLKLIETKDFFKSLKNLVSINPALIDIVQELKLPTEIYANIDNQKIFLNPLIESLAFNFYSSSIYKIHQKFIDLATTLSYNNLIQEQIDKNNQML